MNTIQRIAKNTLVLLVSQATVIFFGFFYYIYTARYLGAEGFGILSFAIALIGIFNLLSDIGLKTLTTREVARDESLAGKYIGNISVIKVILVAITFALVVITVKFLGYPEQTINVVYIITASFLLKSFTDMFYSIFQAFEKMEYISIGRLIDSVLMLAGALVAIELNFEIIPFVTIYFFTSTIVLIYSSLTCLRKFVVPQLEIDLSFWKQMIGESLPFWLTSVFVIIYFRIDMVMLSVMKGDIVVGWYAAPYRLIDALGMLPGLLMTVMYPVFSKFNVNSKESLNTVFNKSFKFLIILAIPIGIGTMLLAEEIIVLMYGNEYIPSVIALKILVWASVLSFINFTPATLLNSTNRQRNLMAFTCIGAVVNIIFNFILIPTMSYVGAGIATVIAELVVGLLMIYEINKFQKRSLSSLHITIAKSLLSALVMGVFVLTFKSYTLLLLIPLASIVYLIMLLATKTFEKEELYLINQALRR